MYLSVIILFSLLTLVAGMFLLSKTRKESLGVFFKFVSWFVIVISFGLFICVMSRGMYRCAMHNKTSCTMQDKNDKCCMPANCKMMCCEQNKEMEMCCKEKERMACMQQKDRICDGHNDMEAMTPEQRAENIVTMLTEKLKLSADQAPKVKDIFLKSLLAMEQQMKDAGNDKEKCGKQCEKIRTDKIEALKKVLTPEQFKNLPEWCSKSCMSK